MSRIFDHAREVVIVAPHPDDETVGAYGLITTLLRRGARVGILVVSDGSASHPGSVSWPPGRLVPERRRETRRAMRAMSILPPSVRFLDLPDGALADDPGLLRRRLDRVLRRRRRPDLIVVPVADDAHADHRAVAQAIGHRHGKRRLGYRVWPLGAKGGRLRLPLDARMRAGKHRALLSYRTQAGRITDSPTGMAMRSHHLRSFARPSEFFRVLR